MDNWENGAEADARPPVTVAESLLTMIPARLREANMPESINAIGTEPAPTVPAIVSPVKDNHTMKKLLIAILAITLSTLTAHSEIVSDPTLVSQLEFTGSNFGAQTLDVSSFTNVEMVFCSGTNITGLLLPAAPANLFYLRASNNALTTMPDVSGCTALTRITFQNCALSEALIDQLLYELTIAKASEVNLNILGNAAPSATGLTYIADMESRGATVEHE